jgi:hypothetical protein
MDDTPQVSIDRIGDSFDWQIFTEEERGTPTVHLLYVVPVETPLANAQIVLTSYDGSHAIDRSIPVFDTEIYSTLVYVADDNEVESLVSEILNCLIYNNLRNPVEAAHLFGGLVRGFPVRSRVDLTSTN